MYHPDQISIKDFTYSLPEELVAKYPLQERDSSRLLIYRDGEISEDIYRNISRHLPENSLLIFNDTKVVEARLLFQKLTGGMIEIFCLEPHSQYGNISAAMQQKGEVLWNCMIGGASKWKHGQVPEKIIKTNTGTIHLRAFYIDKSPDAFTIHLTWDDDNITFAEILHLAGAVPLPPYIKRPPESSDTERYQTIYAREDGSVAAPTAGLHFTPGIFKALKEKNIQSDFVTLHVGAGTFKPVKSETMAGHEMHAEYIHVSARTIENIAFGNHKPVIPVGTTSMRTIESLYWLGVKTKANPSVHPSSLFLTQWEAYALEKKNTDVKEALQALLAWLQRNNLSEVYTKTQLLIVPGYKAKIADALITNFHLPQSTLLLLIAALTNGDRPGSETNWKKIYNYALEKKFRFLSYGDGNLLWIKK